MLEIKNLHARIAEDGTEIIRGLNLTVKAGEVAAIMGPNGSGKSTLSYILAGRDDYEVTEGDILYNGESILELDPSNAPPRASSWRSSTRSKSRAWPPCSS
jgi:Fe-S cluster assembly ATP-binding protein